MAKTFREKLKSITPLRKAVVYFKSRSRSAMAKQLNLLKNENSSLKQDFLTNISAVEKSLLNEIILVKSCLCNFNEATNIMLYENDLAKLTEDKTYEPKVSIIMPVYNGEKYVKQALACALNQTYKNIEIIAVNDGSRDNTDEILSLYSEKITYIKKENGGVSSALNAGIKAMTGDYFAWLSHDDLIDEDHIEKLVRFLRHHKGEKVIPFSAFKIIDENSDLLFEATINAKTLMFDYKTSVLEKYSPLLFGEINGGSVLIPKEAFEKHGLFNENERITQERDMWHRLIDEYRFICVPYDTASIRIHSAQVSNTNSKVTAESNKKNLQIIADLLEKTAAENERTAREMRSYLAAHYYYNGNEYMSKEINQL